MYVHIIVIIVGFTLAITAYLATLINKNWESDFSPVLGVFFLSLCCIYGLAYVLKDVRWKRKIVEGEVGIYSTNPLYNEDDAKDRAFNSMMFIKLSRIGFELRATTNALTICIYLFLAGFILFILSYFLEMGVLMLLAIVDMALFIILLNNGKKSKGSWASLEKVSKDYSKLIQFLRNVFPDKENEEDYKVMQLYIEVVSKKKVPEEYVKLISMHIENNTKPKMSELMFASVKMKSKKKNVEKDSED